MEGEYSDTQIISWLNREVALYFNQFPPEKFFTKSSHEGLDNILSKVGSNFGIREVDDMFSDLREYQNLMKQSFRIENEIKRIRRKYLLKNDN